MLNPRKLLMDHRAHTWDELDQLGDSVCQLIEYVGDSVYIRWSIEIAAEYRQLVESQGTA